VQSGSLFGKYKGDTRGDVVLYSGGLDKTPAACFGAGFGYFRESAYGKMSMKNARHCTMHLLSTLGRLAY
jgi:hypothetical protein